MAQNLGALIRIPAVRPRADIRRIAGPELLPVEMPIFQPEPWLREQDLRDALMTFALAFTGAMVFLF